MTGTQRVLTDSERLDIALDLLGDGQNVCEYRDACEQAEQDGKPTTRKWVVVTDEGFTTDSENEPCENLQVLDFDVLANTAEEAIDIVNDRLSVGTAANNKFFSRASMTARELV